MKFPAQARSRARRYSMQALYQWDLSGLEPAEIQRQFFEAEDFSKADGGYFIELLTEVHKHVDRIDTTLSEVIDRPVARLDPVERSILRIACYEFCTGTIFRVASASTKRCCSPGSSAQSRGIPS